MSLDFDVDESSQEQSLRRRRLQPQRDEPVDVYGELLLAEHSHPTVVAVAFSVALAIVVVGIVASVGVAAKEECSASPAFSARYVGVAASIVVGLAFVALLIAFAVERTLPTTRTRVRNIVFLLSVTLLLVSQWLKMAIDVVVACQPGSAYAITNLASAVAMVGWYVAVIWSSTITR